ncbi:cytochrome P450 [Streptomyces nitrosporeus]|uniref:cytochrome P450 n=1 Tax=Streptomyces nitrosporeus TaxID=28894 RepID=UPI0039A0234E
MTINTLRFGLQGLSFLDAVSDRPDRTVELRHAPALHLLLWDSDDIAEVFRSEQDMRLGESDTLRPLVGARSLLFANGSRHAAYRQVVGPALRGRRLDGHRPAVRAIIERAADELLATDSYIVTAWARRLTLRIIGEILLGDEDSDVLTGVSDLVELALGTPSRTLRYRYLRPPTVLPSLWRTFLRDRDALREHLHTLRPRPTTSGCPALAAELSPEQPPLGHIGGEELTDQLMSLIFAGHETTASAIAWTLYWLACDDELRGDLRSELGASSDDGSSAAALPLLDAVCRESLRITPPATITGHRVLTTDRELLGRDLARGTTLTPCILLAHRQPEAYPSPERFDPGRFLGRKHSGQRYLPFGGGARRCLGADLAMLEMRMTVAAVVRRVELGRPPAGAGTAHRRGPAMGPSSALTLRVRPCS